MINFTTNEEFHQWCADHLSDGFFVGYAPGYPPKIPRASTNIPRMHRARCSTVPTNHVGPYGKCGSTDRGELVEHFAPAGLQYCRHCDPQLD